METIAKFFVLIGLVCVYGVILAFPVMWLWNWLMPDIFGLAEIGFGQALGINLLTGILFKSSISTNNK